jgi:rhamnosyltransferase
MKITAVYVTYNADIILLKKSIESIISQVNKIYIIDNTPNKDLRLENLKNEKVEIIYLGDNFGIAYAQNIGIKKSLNDNADFIMLSDQDTCYPKSYIYDMLQVFSYDKTIAAVAPRFIDSNKTGKDGFISIYPLIFKQIFPKKGLYDVMQVIASGKILRAKYLKDIGLMNENLFIDWVDIEWCWRARKKGYKIIGNADVVINHQLGDNSKNIGFREVNLRSPIRHYYITRNAFYLSLYSKNLDLLHRITLFFKSFRYIIGYPILAKPRLKNLKYVLLGLWHGVNKKLGKLNETS